MELLTLKSCFMFKIDTNIFDSIDIEIENLTLNKIHNLKKNSQLTRKFST